MTDLWRNRASTGMLLRKNIDLFEPGCCFKTKMLCRETTLIHLGWRYGEVLKKPSLGQGFKSVNSSLVLWPDNITADALFTLRVLTEPFRGAGRGRTVWDSQERQRSMWAVSLRLLDGSVWMCAEETKGVGDQAEREWRASKILIDIVGRSRRWQGGVTVEKAGGK